MSSYFLGVDIGATKTHAIIVDESGHVLGFHTDAGGNPEITGFEYLTHLNQRVVRAVCHDANVSPEKITGAIFGIAGFDWDSQLAQFQETTRMVGFTENVIITNDTVLGLAAGSSEGWGVCLVAGTSFNCRGRTLDGREGRVVGDGLLWGEGAGSLELSTYAIQRVMAAWSQCEEPTQLTGALLDFYNESSLPQLIEDLVLFRRKIEPDFAPKVLTIALSGDKVAIDCVNQAASALAKLAIGVIRQLDLAKTSFDVVLAGSMFKADDILIAPLEAQIREVAPDAKLVRLQAPPVVGAIVLAMQQQGYATRAIRHRLLDELHVAHPAISSVE